MITHEIEEFGRRMGIEDLEFSEDGVIAFDIDEIGTLYIEQSQNNEELFVYLSSPYPPYDNDIYKKVLELCSYKNAHPFILHGGVYKDRIIFLSKINFREVTASQIENATQFIINITQKVL